MNQEDAIRIATDEVLRLGVAVISDPPHVRFQARHMKLGKNRSGYVVVFRLDVPAGFEPSLIHVEVYEPDGKVYVPPSL